MNKPISYDEDSIAGHLTTILEISKKLNSSLDLRDVLRKAMENVVAFLNAERGFIMLDEGGVLAVKVTKNFEESEIESGLEISQGVIDQVMKTGQPVLTINAMDDQRFSSRESVMIHQLRSVLCVPLKSKAQKIGVIYLDNRWKSGVFTNRDLNTLVTFANHAGIAIENARLYQNLQDSMKEKLKLQEQVFKEKTKTEVERETNRLREEMAHYLIHDLRNPLTVVMTTFSFLEMNLDELINNKTDRKMFIKAGNNLRLLAEMLNDILDVYRLENENLYLDYSEFNMTEVVEQVLDMADCLKPSDVIFDMEMPVELSVKADRRMIQRILVNLVLNACKWMNKGTILIQGKKDLDRGVVIMEVRDQGPGIPDEFKSQVFERFKRIEVRSQPGFSKGMGLAFCKLAVKAHGGEIQASDNLPKGTCISFEIPLKKKR